LEDLTPDLVVTLIDSLDAVGRRVNKLDDRSRDGSGAFAKRAFSRSALESVDLFAAVVINTVE
jgi:hypothetical protein